MLASDNNTHDENHHAAGTVPEEPQAELPAQIGGLWRRLIAYLLDMLILMLVGMCIGFFLADHLIALGAWGRVVGIPIALLYFAVSDSWVNLGQSPGKIAMGLKVVRHDGAPLSVPAALLRAGICYLPVFLNGAAIDYDSALFWPLSALMTLTFGAAVITAYLMIFNRSTRQSLHDLAVGSYVVRTGRAAALPYFAPLWRGHRIVAGVLLALSLAWLPVSAELLAKNRTLAPLLQLQQAIVHVPHIRNAGISAVAGQQFGAVSRSWTTLAIQAQLDTSDLDQNQLANQLAQLALNQPVDGQRPDTIAIVLSYGYDIGIASNWKANRYVHTPAQWRERLASSAQP